MNTPVPRPAPVLVPHPGTGACNKCLAGRKFIDGKLGFKVNYDKFVARFSFYCQHGKSTALAGLSATRIVGQGDGE